MRGSVHPIFLTHAEIAIANVIATLRRALGENPGIIARPGARGFS